MKNNLYLKKERGIEYICGTTGSGKTEYIISKAFTKCTEGKSVLLLDYERIKTERLSHLHRNLDLKFNYINMYMQGQSLDYIKKIADKRKIDYIMIDGVGVPTKTELIKLKTGSRFSLLVSMNMREEVMLEK